MRFDDITVIVTGGARGMGAEHCRGFVAEGARVVIADVLDDEGAALAAELGTRATYAHLDVTDEDAWSALVEQVEADLGPVGVLVNNAGIGGVPAPLEATTLEDWRRVLAVNLDGSFLGLRACIPSLRRNGGGAVVNVSSFAGLLGSPLLGGYAASKFAVRGLTRVAAMELAADGIRVNSIHPGYISTPLLDGVEQSALRGRVAIERLGTPADVTPAVLFAASSDARYITGAEIPVDGGWSSGEPTPIFVPPGTSLPAGALA